MNWIQKIDLKVGSGIVFPIFVICMVGVAVRMATFVRPSLTKEDSARFVYQADELLKGSGYIFRGRACTDLPPGYPIFLSGLKWILGTWERVTYAQATIALLASLLLYLTLRPRCPRTAFWTSLLISANPWCAYADWKIMSETLGITLSVLVITLALRLKDAKLSRVNANLACFLITFLCMALVLTCPSTIFVVAWLVLWQFLEVRRETFAVAASVLGIVLTMGCWQVHVFRATGHFAPRILTGKVGSLHQGSGVLDWTRAWLVRPTPVWNSGVGLFLWDNPNVSINDIPSRAFRSEEEKKFLNDKLLEWRRNEIPANERQKVFLQLAAEHKKANPFSYHVAMPLARCVALWVDMPQVSHAQINYVTRISPAVFRRDKQEIGTKGAVLRFLKAIASAMALAVHGFYLIVFGIGVYYAFRHHCWWGIGVLLGIFCYTFISSYMAVSEMRRNWVFVPFLVFLGVQGIMRFRKAGSTVESQLSV